VPSRDGKALAVVLARAGSRGVPGKNAAVIAGKPCVLWTIDAAREAAGVGAVALSTDDEAMIRLGRDARIEVVRRPADLATDAARVDDAARHALAEIERRAEAGGRAERVVILYGNVPVRPAGLIDRALDVLAETGCDSVQSYAPVGKHHPWWTARIDPDTGRVRPWEGDVLNHAVFRRQDLPPAYVPDGGVIAVTRRALVLEVPGVPAGPHAFLGRDRRAVITGEGDVVDIDSPIDLAVAEAVLLARRP
jgi:CMP-N,N'-diacetyllegionaminic acid synthase